MQSTLSRTSSPTESRLRARIDEFFSAIGQGFNAYLESRGRLDELRRLNALSDEQLLARGLKRDQIVRHVFRDLLSL